MSYALLFILIVGATHRITMFIIADHFPPIEWVRTRLAVWLIERHGVAWARLPFCAWCVSMYIAAIITVVADVIYGVPAPVFVWLTASGATSVLASVTPTSDEVDTDDDSSD